MERVLSIAHTASTSSDKTAEQDVRVVSGNAEPLSVPAIGTTASNDLSAEKVKMAELTPKEEVDLLYEIFTSRSKTKTDLTREKHDKVLLEELDYLLDGKGLDLNMLKDASNENSFSPQAVDDFLKEIASWRDVIRSRIVVERHMEKSALSTLTSTDDSEALSVTKDDINEADAVPRTVSLAERMLSRVKGRSISNGNGTDVANDKQGRRWSNARSIGMSKVLSVLKRSSKPRQ
jgi:hypothetical protein